MDRGSTMLEFAIGGVVVMFLLIGILEFGRFVAVHQSTSHAVQEAARWGAAVGDGGSGVPRFADCDGIRAAATTAGGLSTLTAADISISYMDTVGSSYGVCPIGGSGPATVNNFDRIVITANTSFESARPFIGPASITVTNRRAIVGGS